MTRSMARNYRVECYQCGTEFKALRPRDKYCSSICKERSRGYRKTPPEKQVIYAARYRVKEQSRLKARRNHLQKQFGLTIEQYEKMLQDQGGGCAICGKTGEEEGRNLAVDHDHKTGEIFGILCWYCNHKIIGRSRDPKLYERAAKFLSKGTGFLVPSNRPKRKTKRKAK